MQQGIVISQQSQEMRHPNLHSVLKLLREVLCIQAPKYLTRQSQRAEYQRQGIHIARILLNHAHQGLEQLGKRDGKNAEHILDLFPELIGLELVSVALEDRMSRSEDTVDDAEVAVLHAFDHADKEVWPLVWEVLTTDETDGVTELTLDFLWRCQH